MPVSTKELKLYDKDGNSNGGPLTSLAEHLTELRNKIIISIASICIATLIGFLFSKGIITALTTIAPEGTTFLQIKPGEFFFTSLRVAFYFGFVIALPVIIWQLASFIVPGLSDKEKRMVVPIALASPTLFFLGSLFAFYFVAPSMFNFLFGFCLP